MAHQSGSRFHAYICLISAVTLLSSITPAMKYVFQHSDVLPIGMSFIRVGIGFALLCAIGVAMERRALLSLTSRDLVQLSLMGSLGVLSYGFAAWGLLYTSVTHYILIYGLLPSFTAVFSFLVGKEEVRFIKVAGIALAFTGCLVSVSEGFQEVGTFGLGDGLVCLFTICMSAHIALSAGLVRRIGIMTSNTVMFGTSALGLFLWTLAWEDIPHAPLSLTTVSLMLYIGAATAAVFFLRAVSLQSLTPVTVSIFHHLTPLWVIGFASIFLDEPIETHTIIAVIVILAGTECIRRSGSRLHTMTASQPTQATPAAGGTDDPAAADRQPATDPRLPVHIEVTVDRAATDG